MDAEGMSGWEGDEDIKKDINQCISCFKELFFALGMFLRGKPQPVRCAPGRRSERPTCCDGSCVTAEVDLRGRESRTASRRASELGDVVHGLAKGN